MCFHTTSVIYIRCTVMSHVFMSIEQRLYFKLAKIHFKKESRKMKKPKEIEKKSPSLWQNKIFHMLLPLPFSLLAKARSFHPSSDEFCENIQTARLLFSLYLCGISCCCLSFACYSVVVVVCGLSRSHTLSIIFEHLAYRSLQISPSYTTLHMYIHFFFILFPFALLYFTRIQRSLC